MSAVALVGRARQAAEALMIDECVVTRGGVPTFDPATGQMTNTPTIVYEGECRLRMSGGTIEQNAQFGGEDVSIVRFVVDLPDEVVVVALEDVVVITSSGDEFAMTREFRVVAISSTSFNFYRSLGVETVE